ncbi:MAG: arsenate reductase [Acidobacteriota bacterium]|nr:arsenate reductase [Acidobacteriota bacterium]
MDRLLRESGVDYEKINYFVEPLGEDKLRDLIGKMQIAPRELLRTNEPAYRELKLGQRTLMDEEIIRLLVEHPELLQRPIVERGARAVLARPAEKIKELIGDE